MGRRCNDRVSAWGGLSARLVESSATATAATNPRSYRLVASPDISRPIWQRRLHHQGAGPHPQGAAPNVIPETKALMLQLASASVWVVTALPWTVRLLK